jgi:hypothetical protein
MTSEGDLELLQAEIRRLRAHNRRYRELVQNLASRLAILEERWSAASSGAPLVTVFETFGRLEAAPAADGMEAPLQNTVPAQAGSNDPAKAEEELNPLVPNPGWKCLAVDRPQLRIGFTLFGMTNSEVEQAIEVIEQRQLRSRDFVPVFVTEQLDLAPFRSRGYVVELALDETSRARRLEFLANKWGLHKLVDLGPQSSSGRN